MLCRLSPMGDAPRHRQGLVVPSGIGGKGSDALSTHPGCMEQAPWLDASHL